MTERKALPDENDPPEDVASLYSWANLHGAKYRDFSAARAQTREKARQRVEQAMEENRLQARQQTGAPHQADPLRPNHEETRSVNPSSPQGGRETAGPPPRFDRNPAPPAAPRDAQPPDARRDDLAAISRGFSAPPHYPQGLAPAS